MVVWAAHPPDMLMSDGASAPVPCHRSSVVEHTLGKGEVTGSSPVGGFKNFGNDHVFHMVRSQPEPD